MTIKTKLTERDFVNVSFVMLYKKVWIKLITLIGIIIITVNIVSFFINTNYIKSISTNAIYGIFILFGLPLLTYLHAKKNYKSNSRVSENIEYRFNEDHLQIIGDSFNSNLTWDKIYKVTQTKNWVLIWHNKQIANAIPKRDLWQGEMTDLKNLLTKHKVKNNLERLSHYVQ